MLSEKADGKMAKHYTPSPMPSEVKAARAETGLSQTKAASLIYFSLRAWQEWESGTRKMHPSAFELFKIKVKK